MSAGEQQQKPSLVIDLGGPEGNVFALVAKACQALERAGQTQQAEALRTWFREVPPRGGVSYDDVRRMVQRYCDVTWLNGQPPLELEDNPYTVILPPEEFNELFEVYGDYVERSASSMTLEQRKLAHRVLARLREADSSHVCVDDQHPAQSPDSQLHRDFGEQHGTSGYEGLA